MKVGIKFILLNVFVYIVLISLFSVKLIVVSKSVEKIIN